jgi:hypothetical protein
MGSLLRVFRAEAGDVGACEDVIYGNLEGSGGGAARVEWDIGLVAAIVRNAWFGSSQDCCFPLQK